MALQDDGNGVRPATVNGPRNDSAARDALDVSAIREQFPALDQRVNGHDLVYLDNAATTHKPRRVIDAVTRFYERDNANIHRGVHALSVRATDAYESARDTVRRFIGAADRREVIFLRGTTEAINLVAGSWGRANLGRDDEIVLTGMEHHSNIVPWQLLCRATGARLRVAPLSPAGEVDLDAWRACFGPRTRLAAFTWVSNAIGTINPVAEMARVAREHGAAVLVDAAQATPHVRVDVGALDADFLAFSGHKVYGPTGIGVLWVRREVLETMPPWQGGGDMIASVTFEKSTWNALPHRFEAGTPNIVGAVGLAEALRFVEDVGVDTIARHERRLVECAVEALSSIDGLRIVGTPARRAAVVSFVLDGIHPHDTGTILDHEGVAVRAGHHCSQPLMDFFGVPATTRASFGVYNTEADVDRLVAAIEHAREVFGA